MPNRANPASDEIRVAEPSSLEIHVTFSSVSREGRREIAGGLCSLLFCGRGHGAIVPRGYAGPGRVEGPRRVFWRQTGPTLCRYVRFARQERRPC